VTGVQTWLFRSGPPGIGDGGLGACLASAGEEAAACGLPAGRPFSAGARARGGPASGAARRCAQKAAPASRAQPASASQGGVFFMAIGKPSGCVRCRRPPAFHPPKRPSRPGCFRRRGRAGSFGVCLLGLGMPSKACRQGLPPRLLEDIDAQGDTVAVVQLGVVDRHIKLLVQGQGQLRLVEHVKGQILAVVGAGATEADIIAGAI